MREGKNHMDVGRVEHLTLSGCEPGGLGGAVTFGTAAVAAGVVRLDLVSTVVALRNMAPKSGSPAHGDSPQGPMLLPRESRPITCQKDGARLTQPIGDFDRRTHGMLSSPPGKSRSSTW